MGSEVYVGRGENVLNANLALRVRRVTNETMNRFVLPIVLGLALNHVAFAAVLPKADMVVAADGSGDFKTIQSALASIPKTNTERTVVFIKNGVYHEKIRVDASFVTLLGESRTGTKIEYPQDNEEFSKKPDNIGRAVVNVNDASDFVLENLSVENTAGVIGPHAFTIFSTGDRGVIVNCDVLSHGADTVAFWRSSGGRTYHANSRFEGSVDFMCPHGWCYVTNCTFYEMKNTAAVWHDGSKDKDMKFVLRDCRFDGTNGWNLARHHHDAQFYFLDCQFSRTMIDRPPFRVIYPIDGKAMTTNDIVRNKQLDKSNVWGERDYYNHCHRDGGDYPWFADNLATAPGTPTPKQINAAWTFNNTWNPESTMSPVIESISKSEGQIAVFFNENVTVKGKPRIDFSNGNFADYVSGSGSNTLMFRLPMDPSAKPLELNLNGGSIIASEAGATMRKGYIIAEKVWTRFARESNSDN
jgi:pectinesterase